MDNKNLKLILNYLHRFLEGPIFTKQKWVAFWRYAGEAVSLVYERIVGLDFSMVYYTKDESIHNSVYTKVPNKVLKRIFADVDNLKDKSFIDVGCGKCYAVVKAGQKGFKKYGGVEYSRVLYEVGQKNLARKGLSVDDVYNEDAKDFEHYDEFNIFFFNNPFDETILGPVAQKIWNSHCNGTCTIYFLNPCPKIRTDAIEEAGFHLVKTIEDENEEYFNINVYTNEQN